MKDLFYVVVLFFLMCQLAKAEGFNCQFENGNTFRITQAIPGQNVKYEFHGQGVRYGYLHNRTSTIVYQAEAYWLPIYNGSFESLAGKSKVTWEKLRSVEACDPNTAPSVIPILIKEGLDIQSGISFDLSLMKENGLPITYGMNGFTVELCGPKMGEARILRDGPSDTYEGASTYIFGNCDISGIEQMKTVLGVDCQRPFIPEVLNDRSCHQQ